MFFIPEKCFISYISVALSVSGGVDDLPVDDLPGSSRVYQKTRNITAVYR